jgi:hypothetical protein
VVSFKIVLVSIILLFDIPDIVSVGAVIVLR